MFVLMKQQMNFVTGTISERELREERKHEYTEISMADLSSSNGAINGTRGRVSMADLSSSNGAINGTRGRVSMADLSSINGTREREEERKYESIVSMTDLSSNNSADETKRYVTLSLETII
jgi:hypothetical protein